MTARAAQPPALVLRRESRFTRLLLALLLLAAVTLVCLGLLGTFNRRRPAFVPQPLRSVLSADYSADPFADKLAGLSPELIESILRDEAGTDAPDRLATVVSDLQTPVPTVVNGGLPPATSTPAPSATPAAVGSSPTATPPADVPPTLTATA